MPLAVMENYPSITSRPGAADELDRAPPVQFVSSTAAKHLLSNSTPIRCRDTLFQVDGLVEKPGHVLRDFQWVPWHETKIEYPGRREEPPTKNEFSIVSVKRDDHPIVCPRQAQNLFIGNARRLLGD